MGEKIIIKKIEIIQGGLFQIDIWFEEQQKGERLFIQGNHLFEMIGGEMQRKYNEWMLKSFPKQ